MEQQEISRKKMSPASWAGLVFAACGLWAIAPACAQGGVPAAPKAQLSTSAGLLAVVATDQADGTRSISVRLDDKPMAEFKTDPGMVLDLLATYSGAGATYVVLRTNLSQGGCGGADVHVLTVYAEGEGGPHVEVSPILQKCMGDVPGVCFYYDENEGEVVAVAGFDLKNGKWVAEEESGAGQQ